MARPFLGLLWVEGDYRSRSICLEHHCRLLLRRNWIAVLCSSWLGVKGFCQLVAGNWHQVRWVVRFSQLAARHISRLIDPEQHVDQDWRMELCWQSRDRHN